jgi:deoxyribodipyrimidine photo-lyase
VHAELVPFDGASVGMLHTGLLAAHAASLPEDGDARLFQPGGEAAGWAYLNSFVRDRLRTYRRSISKPQAARRGCSRLSPYLAWGNLTVRQVMHALADADPPWRQDLQFFVSRLHWHCHFIQKFESECRLEWENLNFRMRSMLVSFLTHHLWQPWQAGVHHLAQQFLDFEPGIHYPQFQMQAGTMGVNTLRIYNPVKQAEENDPDGSFLRQWLPELAELPLPFLREPWKMTELEMLSYGVRLGLDYPNRIVDHEEAARKAREFLWGTKRSPAARSQVGQILARHVSARKNAKRRGGQG